MNLLDGKLVSEHYKQKIKTEVAQWVANGNKPPHLAAVIVGNDGASEAYVANKVKTCAAVGFNSTLIRLPSDTTQAHLNDTIDSLNDNKDIDGFIVQMPLPPHLDSISVTERIKPSKDVDGFHPINMGRMMLSQPCYLPATPKGILLLLEYYKIETKGKHCVVIGRSNIVGSPMTMLMSRKANPGNATVTICHSGTTNLKHFTLQADILIAALGQAEFVKEDMVKHGAVVIDVGITRVDDNTNARGYRLAGDVAFNEVAPLSSYITPVPGGVGLMTVVGLLLNTLAAAKKEVYN